MSIYNKLRWARVNSKNRLLFMALTLFLVSALLCSGCEKAPEEIPSLSGKYEDYFLVGAAANYRTIDSHRKLLDKHFSSITAENEMKFESLQPSEGKFNWATADKMVEYAMENGKRVRGHTLVWHNQTPFWVFQADRDLLLERMETHIKAVVGRYAGKVYAWDVVNEAISDGYGDLRTESPWYRIIGEDYIEHAFRFAHEADPEALLFYNDYNAYDPTKREKIYRLVKGLQEKGVPIHGVGMQGHWDLSWPGAKDIEAAIKLYSSLGLKVEITELDLSLYQWSEQDKRFSAPPSDRLKKQAEKCREIFALFRKYQDVITNVTFWGIADDETWKDNFPVRNRKDWPLLFDVNHDPKLAFGAVVDF